MKPTFYIRFTGLAIHYAESAEVLLENHENKPSMGGITPHAVHFLCAHALELALKSAHLYEYVVDAHTNGELPMQTSSVDWENRALDSLRKKFGHDIFKLWKKSDDELRRNAQAHVLEQWADLITSYRDRAIYGSALSSIFEEDYNRDLENLQREYKIDEDIKWLNERHSANGSIFRYGRLPQFDLIPCLKIEHTGNVQTPARSAIWAARYIAGQTREKARSCEINYR